MVQQIKDPVLSLLWLGSKIRCSFDPWPGNFHMPWAQSKEKKKKAKILGTCFKYTELYSIFCDNL